MLCERDVMNTGDVATFADQLAAHVNIEGASDQFNAEVKKWFKGNLRNWIINEYPVATRLTTDHLPDGAPDWMTVKANSAEGLYHVDLTDETLRDMVNGALEYFTNNTDLAVNNVARISVPAMLEHIKNAEEKAKKAEEKEKIAKMELIPEEGVEVVYDYGDGWSWRKMTTRQNMKRETAVTGVCVGNDGQPYMNRMERGQGVFYSLRDPQNNGKVTIEHLLDSNGSLGQVKGNRNSMAVEYADKIADFVSRMKFKNVQRSSDFTRTVPENLYTTSTDGTIVAFSALEGDIAGDVILDRTEPMSRKDRIKKETNPSKTMVTIGLGKPTTVTGDFIVHDTDMTRQWSLNFPTLVVHGDFNLIDIHVKMPSAVAVGGDANWARAALMTCPDAINVRGDLHFPRMTRGLPTKLRVGGTLFVPKAMEAKIKAIAEDNQKISVV